MTVLLFSLTSFVSAFLLFWVQPLITKLLLPLLGGTPAVWNTAMMFFQLTLLAGYIYAHLLSRLKQWRQCALHGALLIAAAVSLPFGQIAGLQPPTENSPIFWLLGTLATLVGLPFFALSASAPLLGAWFGRSLRREAGDPYFLYAASNAGSLAALLAFPVVLERLLSLPMQWRVWAAGFVVLILLFILCGSNLRWSSAASTPATEPDTPARPRWHDRALWVGLAFVPSSLLLGVTTYVSTDLASVPLLWVVPLALYLLTFIIAFGSARANAWAPLALVAGLTVVTVLLVCERLLGLTLPVWVAVPGHIGGFFAIALGCHCWLAQRRPPAARLTEFYLWLSVGGALGGILNALIAPLLFSSTYEYDLGLVCACGLRVAVGRRETQGRVVDVVLALILLAGVMIATTQLKSVAWLNALGPSLPRLLTAVACAAVLLEFSRRPLRFAAAVAFLLGGGLLGQTVINVEHQERSFFGVHRVKSVEEGTWHVLIHGNIVHGVEATDPAHWTETTTYYNVAGPAGQFFARLPPVRRVALIGLGTGGLICYRTPGAEWTFFEIDAAVSRIAHDRRYFHFLEACGDAPVVLGDGRLSLDATTDGSFDLIVLDAFSSDSIPVHLLTREAIQLYLRKLAPHGRLLVHISNRYLGLRPVVAAAVADLHVAALAQFYAPTAAEIARWATESEWVAIARDPADLDFLRGDSRWETTSAPPGFRPWTDDFSNVLGVMRW